MARIAKAEFAQDLTDLFPVLEPISLSPTSLSPELLLVHLFIGPGTLLRKAEGISDVGGAGVLILNSSRVPALNTYFYVFAAQLTHNDVVNRALNIGINVQGQNISLTGGINNNTFAGGAVLSVPRAFILPNTKTGQISTIFGSADALGAGAALTLRYIIMELKNQELHPFL